MASRFGLKLRRTRCTLVQYFAFALLSRAGTPYQYARGTPQATKEAILCLYHKLWLNMGTDSGMLARARSSEWLRFT